MTFVMTLVLTFALVAIALLVFWKLGPPVYRLERRNLISLLELVVAGQRGRLGCVYRFPDPS